MRRPRSEVVVVVVALAVLIATAVPWVQRARISANESAVFTAIRTLGPAQDEYARLNGGRFGTLECLARPAGCLASYPTERPGLITAEIASLETRDGYTRRFELLEGGLDYQYWAVPERPGRSGVRAFCVDGDALAFRALEDSGRRCESLRPPGVFDGVRADAERRRKERERLRAAATK